jgi:RNA-binding protein YlmH
VISVRGGGRIVLLQIGGKSKKDRTYLTMEVFARGRVQI